MIFGAPVIHGLTLKCLQCNTFFLQYICSEIKFVQSVLTLSTKFYVYKRFWPKIDTMANVSIFSGNFFSFCRKGKISFSNDAKQFS